MKWLIDADALAEVLKRQAELHKSDGLLERSYGVLDAYTYVLRATIGAVPVGWIPCKERLPEESGMYIVSGKQKVWVCKFTRINIAGVKIGGWENDARNPVVTAWMPLPEPYKEEDGG